MQPESAAKATDIEHELAARLAAHDEIGAASAEQEHDELKAGLSPDAAARLGGAIECLTRIRGLWPHPEHPVEWPQRFGKFMLERELGRGGHGIVFLALDPALGRRVAVKIPRAECLDDPDLKRRFLREGRALALLDHPGIVPILELGEIGPVCYIVSTFCEGPNLGAWLKVRQSPLSFQTASGIVADIAEAVGHANARGVTHRDLKPQNIMIDTVPNVASADGSVIRPRLTDFGLAKLMEAETDLTHTGVVIGTPRYMAPEQASGRGALVGPPADVYALGAILQELLTGHPFQSNEPHEHGKTTCAVEDAASHAARDGDSSNDAGPISSAVVFSPVIPPGLRAIVTKCLEQEPGRRYPDGGELAADLRRFLAGERTRAQYGFSRWLLRRWPSMNLALGALALAGVTAALTLGASMLWALFSPVNPPPRRPTITARASHDPWRLAFERVHPFDAVPDVFAGNPTVIVKGGLLERHRAASGAHVLLKDTSYPGIEVRATFVQPGWTECGRLGLTLGEKNHEGYRFELFVPEDEPSATFAKSLTADRFVAARIVRDGVTVREYRWRASALPGGPLELTASRLGNLLKFEVGALRPALELLDVAPDIRPAENGSGATPDMPAFGLVWPETVAIAGLRIRLREIPGGHDPHVLRDADAFFKGMNYKDAAKAYQLHETSSSDPALIAESRYKRALCLARSDSSQEAASLFNTAAQASAAAPEADARLWAAPAAFQALRIASSGRASLTSAEIDSLEIVINAVERESYAQEFLAAVVTEPEREEFMKHAAPFAFTDNPFHLLRATPDRISSVDRAIQILDRLDPSGSSSVGPQRELLRLLLSNEDYGRAESVAYNLLDGRKTIGHEWRLAATRDAVWLAIELSRRPGISRGVAHEKLEKALHLIERCELDASRFGLGPAAWHPLRVEKARLLAALGKNENAVNELRLFLNDPRLPAIGALGESFGARFAPPENVLALYYLEACLLMGFLHEKAGNEPAAQKVWSDGFLRVRGTRVVSFMEAAMLGSLSGKIENDEVEFMIGHTALGAGLHGIPLVTLLYKTTGIDVKAFTPFVSRTWASERGRASARRIVFREMNFHDSLSEQIRLSGYEVFKRGVQGPADLRRELTPDQDERLWALASDIISDYRENKWGLENVIGPVKLAIGVPWVKQAWAKDHAQSWCAAKWSGDLIYVIACHYHYNLNDQRFASELFDEALRKAPPGSALRRLIEAETKR